MPRESLQMCSKTESLCGRPVPQSQRESDRQVPGPCPQEAASASTFRGGTGHRSLEKGKVGRAVPSPRRTGTGTPVAPGVPLGLRRLLTRVEEKMCWKTLLLLLLCYDAQATVAHRWSRGELLFIICLMLIALF